VARLRAGEATFEDEASEGRSKSLGASLGYGFASAFTEEERVQLALLHFFQGFVDVDTLRRMGALKMITGEDYSLPEVCGLTREAGIALLDRAAEIGLLTAHGGGYYSIHPALPWYFKSLFQQYYSSQLSVTSDQPPLITDHSSLITATRAFVEALGELGNYYHYEYERGNSDVISALAAEEVNLLHARQLALRHARSAARGDARANGWWGRVISTMQGLDQLYDHTGRRAEWARLVNEIVPDFVDPASDGPLLGRHEDWNIVTEYRVRLAIEMRLWAEAERLQRIHVEQARLFAAAALAAPSETLDGAQSQAIRSLAVSLERLGQIQVGQEKPECADALHEAIPLCQRIGDKAEESKVAFNLGRAYRNVPAIYDLARAEYWFRRSLELSDERDRFGHGRCLSQLGLVAYERFLEARAVQKPDPEQYLRGAEQFCYDALDLFPSGEVEDLAAAHNLLGIIHAMTGNFDRALPHYREAVRYFEAAGNLYKAAGARFNVAFALRDRGRLADAREYAYAALRNFETYGERAAEEIQKTRGLIEEIEKEMGK